MKIELKQMSLHKEAEADIWLEQTPREMGAVSSPLKDIGLYIQKLNAIIGK